VVKLGFDIVGYDWHIATNTLLIIFAAFQVIVIGLLADLVTRATRGRSEAVPATADYTGVRTAPATRASVSS